MDKKALLYNWLPVKESRHNISQKKIPKIANGEVWWVAIGENVGVEINGKSKYFSRPVLVFQKLGYLGFMGIPLSTQKHTGTWYVNFSFQNKDICAVLSQARVFSASRIYNRLGQVDEEDMKKIQSGFYDLYIKNFP